MTAFQEKRMLAVATRQFWPPSSGRKVVLYNYFRQLHEKLGYRIHLYCFLEADQEPDEDGRPDFIEEVVYAKSPSLAPRIPSLLRALVDGSFPLQCAAYVDRDNRRELERYAREVEPDALFVDMIRLVPYMESLEGVGTRVLDLDDMLSLRYERQRRRGGASGEPLGKFGDSRTALARLAAVPAVADAVLRIEAERTAKAELKYAGMSDHVVFVSPKEAEGFQTRGFAGSVAAAPMGVDFEYFSAMPAPERRPRSLSFVGDLGTATNRDTLEYLLAEVMPLLKGCELRVVGPCPPSIAKRHGGRDGLALLGRVDDLRRAVLETEVFLAPIAYGTGIKTKILEAMAMGVPVVTNSVGIEGLGVSHGVHCMVCETPEEQASAVEALIHDSQMGARMAKAAQEYVKAEHQWSLCAEVFEELGL